MAEEDSSTNLLIKFLLASLIPSLISSQKVPSIGFISPDIITDIGGDVKLECAIKHGSEYPILWMRLDERGSDFPISTGTNLLISDSRFSLEQEEDSEGSGTYTLTIRDVRETDAARYQCQVIIELNNKKTADVLLQVRLPPDISDDTPSNVQSVEGQEIELSCEAKGFPTPRVVWTREDGFVLPNGKSELSATTLTIKNTRREDRGNYVCRASNGVGKGQSRTITVEVEFAPEIEIDRPRTPQAVDYDVELSCNIQAFPAPAINWYFHNNSTEENVTITNSENYEISHFASADDITTSRLKIFGVREEQFGIYLCQAANRHGTVARKMELYFSDIPICPPVCSTNLNSGNLMVQSLSPILILSYLSTLF